MIKMRPLAPALFKFITHSICKTICCSVFFLSFIISCSNDKPDKIGAVVDRTKLPKLHATEITTIISDSGITRYRITASRWDIFDKASQPYQEFPDGIYFEKFDANMKVDANIQSKYARYNENEQTWELRGKVRAMNLQGELFETEKLFWNQRQAKFYTDNAFKFTQTSQIIRGIGFESNETMTQYIIKNPQGEFPLNENAASEVPVTNTQPVTPVSVPAPVTVPKITVPTIKSNAPTPSVTKKVPPNLNLIGIKK